jgi:hypothetical protein
MGDAFFSLEKLPSTCDRTIFLKNIYSQYKPITRGKSANDIQNKVNTFFSNVGCHFELFFEKNYELSKQQNISFEESISLNRIECLYTLFTQIKSSCEPVAYNGGLLKEFYVNKKKLEQCFDGYKYTLQYLWFKTVDNRVFEKTSLKNLHLSDSWNNYKYIKDITNKHPFPMLSEDTLVLEEQTNLDSYFFRIKEEIILPLEEKKRINILTVSKLFQQKEQTSVDKSFGTLLSKGNLKDPYDNLTDNEKLDIAFYWYPLEVFEPGKLHNGIAAFITTLVGTVELNNSGDDNEFDKIIVRKFIHPLKEGENVYSFGVLIDTKAASGHFTSGWLIYFDCCGDYSGFSSTQYNRAQSICMEYKKNGSIEFKEVEVEKHTFAKYIAEHIISYPELKRVIEKEIEENIEKESAKYEEIRKSFYDTIKKVVLEQLVYYAYTRAPSTKSVEWSIGKNVKEVDILVEYDNSKKCIECKWNTSVMSSVKFRVKSF